MLSVSDIMVMPKENWNRSKPQVRIGIIPMICEDPSRKHAIYPEFRS
jgi:hypothetical protein